MASREKVDQLFELPIFKELMPSMLQPMQEAFADFIIDDPDERSSYLHDAMVIQGDMYDAMIAIVKDMYEASLTDEEADVLIEMYQVPAFMKLVKMMPTMMPRFFQWIHDNQEELTEKLSQVGATDDEKDT